MAEDKVLPKIGKNVIETLTLGMYENPFFIYREYVQNSADQIDIAVEENILKSKSEGQININIDRESRIITIRDNATGIKSQNALKFLGNVADSQKDRNKRKGFRGIGRLGGLGYCTRLIFETTYKGEHVKSIMSLNATYLRQIIENKDIDWDAAQVISTITKLQSGEADIDDHFFEVRLEGVYNSADELLNEDKVNKYLSQTAPIPFDKDFSFGEEIKDNLLNMGLSLEEYDVHLNVNNKPLFKPYKDSIFDDDQNELTKITGINYFRIVSEEKDLLAVGWNGISSSLNKALKSIYAGIRLRKNNIQIGDKITLNKHFSEARFNDHFIGEVHIIHDNFIPNARRDYFNENASVISFQQNFKRISKDLVKMGRHVSFLHSRLKDIKKFKAEKERVEKENYTPEQYKATLEPLHKKALESSEKLTDFDFYNEYDSPEHQLYQEIVGEYDITIDGPLDTKRIANKKLSFSKLNEQQSKIVFEIIDILDQNLDIEVFNKIKNTLIEKYNS